MRYVDPVPELKDQLAAELAELIEGYSAGIAAAHMGVNHRRVCDIRAGRLERFSLETLIRFAAHLGCRVDLSVDTSHRLTPR
jgi:predicted XRE-type DNA-binding protein